MSNETKENTNEAKTENNENNDGTKERYMEGDGFFANSIEWMLDHPLLTIGATILVSSIAVASRCETEFDEVKAYLNMNLDQAQSEILKRIFDEKNSEGILRKHQILAKGCSFGFLSEKEDIYFESKLDFLNEVFPEDTEDELNEVFPEDTEDELKEA